MIGAIVSLFNFVRGLFAVGGLFGGLFTWLSSSAGWFASAFLWLGSLIKDLFVGTAVAFKRAMVYISAYHLVEFARRIAFIAFITTIFGYIINYAVNNVVVSAGKTISTLFTEFITSINSFGPLGHNLLAFMSKMGFFDALSLLITVMIYTLMTRVALSILFK